MTKPSTLPPDLARRLAAVTCLYLICDYDGTLTPIVSRPSEAKLAFRVKETLRRLACASRTRVAIVSGRNLRELVRLVGLPKIDYVGNHGLEQRIRCRRRVDPWAARLVGPVLNLARELRAALRPIPAAWVENKIYTLSVHYRRVKTSEVAKVRRIVERTWSRFSGSSLFRLKKGKKVWEIRPRRGRTDKGKAVRALLKTLPSTWRKRATVVYLGDDQTDEDAFRVVHRSGIGIRIGAGKRTSAHYRLRSPAAVLNFLERLAQVRMTGDR
ncbi:MAG: trehalose-phosphatase [Candidatus Omnitrophota bacterium]